MSLSNNLVMAVGDSETDVLDGINIEQRLYVDNTSYKDEWLLYSYGDNAYKVLALDEEGINRKEYFNDVSSIFEEHLGDDALMTSFTNIPKDEMKRMMCDSDIFIVHTHGQKDEIYVSSNEALSMNDMNGLNLKDLKFALLLPCYNGKDFSESNIANNKPTNIVEKMVCNGAETVIGFTQITYVDDCNKFATDFITQTIISGETVEDAINNIDYSDYYMEMSEIAVIGGNKDLYLCE